MFYDILKKQEAFISKILWGGLNVLYEGTNFIYDILNIPFYPSIDRIINVKQMSIIEVFDDICLYKIKIRLKEDRGITINNIYDYQKEIEDFLGNSVEFEIIDFKNLYIRVLKSENQKNVNTMNEVKYRFIPLDVFEKERDLSMVKYTFVEGEKEGVSCCIGYDIQGNIKVFDILEGHTMAGGASRWGKSNFLNTFITNIMRTYTENEVVFAGCDFKKSDLYYFRKYKHFSTAGISTNKKDFLRQMENLDKEIDKRSKILEEANCRNVIKFNKKSEVKLPYIIFIVDELMQLTRDDMCNNSLHYMMSKCASYGIYFILASQDFTKNTVGKCKMNCSQVVGFHTSDSTDSETLIGKGHDLQNITVKGRCKIKNSNGVVETQIFYIEEEEMEEILKPYEK